MRGLVKRFFVLRGVCAAFFNNHYEFEWGGNFWFFQLTSYKCPIFFFSQRICQFRDSIRCRSYFMIWSHYFYFGHSNNENFVWLFGHFSYRTTIFLLYPSFFFHQPQYLCKTIFIIDVLALFMFWHGFFPSFAVVLSLFLFSFFVYMFDVFHIL